MVGKRISIRGTSGSGKSTLGKALSVRFDIPYTELDSLYHMPNWQPRPTEEFRAMVAEVVTRDAWIVDGNYSVVNDIVLTRVETVIWLDYSLPVILWRLTGRIFRRGLRKEELWNGNREVLWRHFLTRDSLYVWVLQTYRKRRRQAEDFFRSDDHPHVSRMRFRHPREAERWLRGL